jgi:hypothetical protein
MNTRLNIAYTLSCNNVRLHGSRKKQRMASLQRSGMLLPPLFAVWWRPLERDHHSTRNSPEPPMTRVNPQALTSHRFGLHVSRSGALWLKLVFCRPGVRSAAGCWHEHFLRSSFLRALPPTNLHDRYLVKESIPPTSACRFYEMLSFHSLIWVDANCEGAPASEHFRRYSGSTWMRHLSHLFLPRSYSTRRRWALSSSSW